MSPARIVVAVLALAVLAAGPASAASCASADVDQGDIGADDLANFAQAYNENVDRLPSVLRDRLAGERVELHVVGASDIAYTVTTGSDGTITDVARGEDDPSLRVTVRQRVICDAAASDDPTGTLLAAYRNGRIDVEGVGTVNRITVSVGKAVFDIGHSLGFW